MDDCWSYNKNLNVSTIVSHFTCLKYQYYADKKKCILNRGKYPNEFEFFNDYLQIVMKEKDHKDDFIEREDP